MPRVLSRLRFAGKLGLKTAAQHNRGAFSLVVVLVAVVTGVVSFAAFLVLLAFADDLRRPQDGGEHALSKSAVGFAGLMSVLQDTGRQVRVNRGPLEHLNTYNELVILTPPARYEFEYDDYNAIAGQVLIILPKWETGQDRKNPEWVTNRGLLRPEAVLSSLGMFEPEAVIDRAGTSIPSLIDADTGDVIELGSIDALQTIEGPNIIPILTDTAGNTVFGEIVEADEEYTLGFVLSDPDLLNNHGLASVANLRAGLRAFDIIQYDTQPIVFDMTLHGVQRSRNILQLLFTPPFLSGVLCLVFAGVLIAITAFAGNLRAGGTRDIPLGKTTLVDNSARLIALAGRSKPMAQRYVALIRKQAARILGAPAGAGETDQVAILDATARNKQQAGGKRFSDLTRDVTQASNVSATLRALNRLYVWKQELGRERKRR